MLPQAVLFDLDGTLCDSAPDMAAAVDLTLEQTGLQPAGLDKVRGWVGDGVAALVERALRDAGGQNPEPEALASATAMFLEAYQSRLCVDSKLYPGIQQLLKTLKDRDIALGVVTNKPAAFTEPLLEALGIATFFGSTISGDTCAERKPHPLPVLTALEELGAAPARSAMIGDSPNDALSARAAGTSALLMTWGYNVGVDLKSLDTDGLFDDADSLAARLLGDASRDQAD